MGPRKEDLSSLESCPSGRRCSTRNQVGFAERRLWKTQVLSHFLTKRGACSSLISLPFFSPISSGNPRRRRGESLWRVVREVEGATLEMSWRAIFLGFESLTLRHKRTLILIQRLAFFLCPKSLAPQGFFHFAGCMERAFPLFFGCKRRLMLVSPYCGILVGCMIKRLRFFELAAVLYWVHMRCSWNTGYECEWNLQQSFRVRHLEWLLFFNLCDIL